MRPILVLLIVIACQPAIATAGGFQSGTMPVPAFVEMHHYFIQEASAATPQPATMDFRERLVRPHSRRKKTAIALMIGGGAVALVGAALLITGATYKPVGHADTSGEAALLAGGVLAAGGLGATLTGVFIYPYPQSHSPQHHF